MLLRSLVLLAVVLIGPTLVGCATSGARAAAPSPVPEQPHGIVESTGETAVDPEPDGRPRQTGGSLPDPNLPPPPPPPDSPAPRPLPDPASWPVYRNDQYGFELRFPPAYFARVLEGEPGAVFVVGFFDRQLAASPTADLQPPRFAVYVYDRPADQTLEEWLRRNDRLRDGGMSVTPVAVGGVDAVRVTSMLLIAPNEFVYVARGPFVYELVPLGEFGDQMLDTVRFTP